MARSGVHRPLPRSRRKVLNSISGKLVTMAKDAVRTRAWSPEQGKRVVRFAQALLRNRPHLLREAVADLDVDLPHSLVSQAETVLGRSLR